MVTILTLGERTRVTEAIVEAESRTSGEIFCVFARRVSGYWDVSLVWAAVAAFLIPLLLIPLGLDLATLPPFGDSWVSAHVEPRTISDGRAFAVYALIQAAVFVIAFLITRVPFVHKLVIPAVVRRARVRRAALQQFLAHGVHVTASRTGVLIFAALNDRQVEIIADEGIHSQVDEGVWVEAVQVLTQAMKAGRPAEGFEAAIALTGQVLAEKFPPRANDPDELPNRLVEI